MNNNKVLRLSLHGAGWLLFSFLMASFLKNGDQAGTSYYQIIFSAPFLFFIFFYAVVFYLNTQVLMSLLFLRKKYFSYFLATAILLLVCLYLTPFDRVMRPLRPAAAAQTGPAYPRPPQPPPPKSVDGHRGPGPRTPMNGDDQPRILPGSGRDAAPLHLDIISLILFFMILAGSALLVLSRQWRKAEKNKSMAEVQKARAELAFLKAQVSPHFLFNTLNNIYALSLTRSDKTPSALLRLSNIMRYITDEASLDFVPLEKEIASINDYIELQKLRMGKTTELHYTLTGVYTQTRLAPLILMAFVENAFKHGISKNQPATIDISIHADSKLISLHTRNILLPETAGQRNGTGLTNVKQRLELLYPGAYSLQTRAEGDYFVVDLMVKTPGTWN